MYITNRMLPNETKPPEPFSISKGPTSTIASLSFQQESRWSVSDIGTVVFGCISSILGILALWQAFWMWQRQGSNVILSGTSPVLSLSHTGLTTGNQ